MTKYDSILTPCSESEATHRVDKNLYKQQVNVIVLTIEEALDIWKAGMKRATDIAKLAIRNEEGNPDAPDFKTYLTSKSINI